MIQHERQKEGEEFKDKDQFVTPSYLAQQEELRKTEAEEKKKEGESLPWKEKLSYYISLLTYIVLRGTSCE